MASDSEEFFIRQIDAGLGIQALPLLTEREKQLLLTSVSEASWATQDAAVLLNDLATELGMTLEQFTEELRPLIAKCVSALDSAYRAYTSYDTSTHKSLALDEALAWRRHNKVVYDASRCQLSGVVQQWYLRGGGQELERKLSVAKPCFVATAVFNSESHWVVERLRHFRESVLAVHCWGRPIVTIYNRVGPAAARQVAHRPHVKAVLRRVLTLVVQRWGNPGETRDIIPISRGSRGEKKNGHSTFPRWSGSRTTPSLPKPGEGKK